MFQLFYTDGYIYLKKYVFYHVLMFNIAKKFIYNGRWKIKSDEMPIAHPYVEFKRGMLLEIEPTKFLED
jgi:hypothetical protein